MSVSQWSLRPLSLTALGAVVRGVLALVVALLILGRGPAGAWLWLGLALGVDLATIKVSNLNTKAFWLCVESTVLALGIIATSAPESPLLPYLAVPALCGGLLIGAAGALAPSGVAAMVLLAGALLQLAPDGRAYSTTSAEWVLIALLMGMTGAWARRVAGAPAPLAGTDPAYASAHRLLSQLRAVARELPVGLDPGTVGRALLENLLPVAAFDRAAVAARTSGGRMVVLAHQGGQRPDWAITIDTDGSPFQDAWISQEAQVRQRRFDGRPGHSLVLPLLIGVRSSGLVALEASHAWSAEQIERARQLVATTAMQLEAALLFDEVRELATAEERRRLAREIHDGVAQELSYVGYVLDGLAAQARKAESDLEPPVRELRSEVTRLISELRLSMFELNSDVATHGSLGAALSEHVQSIAKPHGIAVHLSLQETGGRLPAETEAELLRIGQEAFAEIRRSAGTRNIWVTLQVDTPAASLCIEHDGRAAAGRRRDDVVTQRSMQERASRIRAALHVRAREGGGTVLEVQLGTNQANPA